MSRFFWWINSPWKAYGITWNYYLWTGLCRLLHSALAHSSLVKEYVSCYSKFTRSPLRWLPHTFLCRSQHGAAGTVPGWRLVFHWRVDLDLRTAGRPEGVCWMGQLRWWRVEAAWAVAGPRHQSAWSWWAMRFCKRGQSSRYEQTYKFLGSIILFISFNDTFCQERCGCFCLNLSTQTSNAKYQRFMSH